MKRKLYDIPQTTANPPMPEVKPFKQESYNPIQSQLQPYCKGCLNIEPFINTKKYYGNGKIVEHEITLNCAHALLCKQLAEHFKEE